MVKLSQLSCGDVNLLLFCRSGILPNTQVCDLGVATKGEARDAVRRQFLAKTRRNPTRLATLTDDLDNLPLTAFRLGYPLALFSPMLRDRFTHVTRDDKPTQPSLPPTMAMPLPLADSPAAAAPGSCAGATATVAATAEATTTVAATVPASPAAPASPTPGAASGSQVAPPSVVVHMPPLKLPGKF